MGLCGQAQPLWSAGACPVVKGRTCPLQARSTCEEYRICSRHCCHLQCHCRPILSPSGPLFPWVDNISTKLKTVSAPNRTRSELCPPLQPSCCSWLALQQSAVATPLYPWVLRRQLPSSPLQVALPLSRTRGRTWPSRECSTRPRFHALHLRLPTSEWCSAEAH